MYLRLTRTDQGFILLFSLLIDSNETWSQSEPDNVNNTLQIV